MKNLVYLLGAAAAALALFLLRNQTSAAPVLEPVETLAHELEEAWADHHTVV